MARRRYAPYGQERWAAGTLPTDFGFTGQRDVPGTGWLYFYGARWYDPALGRFISADTLVPSPSDPQSLNRYSYVRNNPVKYTDPSGHFTDKAIQTHLREQYGDDWQQYWHDWNSDSAWMDMLHKANAGDVFAGGDWRYNTGNPLILRFIGEGEDILSGAEQLTDLGRNVGTWGGINLDYYRMKGYGYRISGLIRFSGDNAPEIIPTAPFRSGPYQTYTRITDYQKLSATEAFAKSIGSRIAAGAPVSLISAYLGIHWPFSFLFGVGGSYFVSSFVNDTFPTHQYQRGDELIIFQNLAVVPSFIEGLEQGDEILSQRDMTLRN